MNSSEGLSFTSNAEYNDFVKVLVNDKEVESKYYTVKEGSTIVTLQPSFLGTLKEGTYNWQLYLRQAVQKHSLQL